MFARRLIKKFSFERTHQSMEPRKKYMREVVKFNEKFERKCKEKKLFSKF